MKNISIFWLIALFIGCQTKTTEQKPASTASKPTTALQTAAYVCPMHCENKHYEKDGTCPVCKMGLVKDVKTIKGNARAQLKRLAP